MAIQIIEENRKPKQSFGASIMGGLAEGLPAALQQYQQYQRQSQQMQQENEAAKRMGIDLAGFSHPEDRRKIMEYALRGREMQQEYGFKKKLEDRKRSGDLETEKKDFDNVKQYFGEKFANVWKAAPIGGRTELIKTALDVASRGGDINKILDQYQAATTGLQSPQQQDTQIPQQQGMQPQEEPQKVPQSKKGEIPKGFKLPDYSKRPQGYTQKEWIQQKGDWRKENVPIFESLVGKIKSQERDKVDIKKLDQLNESRKIGEGFEAFLIDPATGDFRGLAQMAGIISPEAQQWVKIISRFQNRAKDAFGSRVTNFDLQSYMKQFPGLLNTYEGRKRILRMMDINNSLDELHDRALQNVYRHYKLSGVSQEDADELATSMTKDETDRLNNEYLQLDQENQNFQPSQGLSGKMVDVLGPDGQLYEVDQSEIDQLPEGFRLQE